MKTGMDIFLRTPEHETLHPGKISATTDKGYNAVFEGGDFSLFAAIAHPAFGASTTEVRGDGAEGLVPNRLLQSTQFSMTKPSW